MLENELLRGADWPKISVRCSRNPQTGNSMFAWFPGEVAADPARKQRVKEILHTASCYGILDSINRESLATRVSWGKRLGTGKEGSVFRPIAHPDYAVKIFKTGKGINIHGQENAHEVGLAELRAGRGVMIHNLLADLFEGDTGLHSPRAHGMLIDPDAGVALTALDFVEGQTITDEQATEVFSKAENLLSRFGLTKKLIADSLHDISFNGGNVLKMSDGRFSIIDR